jgi:hypothetical protein
MPAKPRQRGKIAGMGQPPTRRPLRPPQKRRKPGLAQLQLAESRVVTGVERNLAKG